MSKKQNIMEINGRRYDAHTGAPVGHTGHGHQAARPITVHHVSTPPAAAAARRPAKHAAHHRPQRSTTLMRRAVRRPDASLKRHVKAQGHTGVLVENPPTPVVHPPMFDSLDSKRLRRAGHIKKSSLIMHFNPHQPAYRSGFRIPVSVNQPAKPSAPAQKKPKTVPRQPAPDINAIFDRAIQNATSHLEPAPKKTRKHRLHFASRRHHAKA